MDPRVLAILRRDFLNQPAAEPPGHFGSALSGAESALSLGYLSDPAAAAEHPIAYWLGQLAGGTPYWALGAEALQAVPALRALSLTRPALSRVLTAGALGGGFGAAEEAGRELGAGESLSGQRIAESGAINAPLAALGETGLLGLRRLFYGPLPVPGQQRMAARLAGAARSPGAGPAPGAQAAPGGPQAGGPSPGIPPLPGSLRSFPGAGGSALYHPLTGKVIGQVPPQGFPGSQAATPSGLPQNPAQVIAQRVQARIATEVRPELQAHANDLLKAHLKGQKLAAPAEIGQQLHSELSSWVKRAHTRETRAFVKPDEAEKPPEVPTKARAKKADKTPPTTPTPGTPPSPTPAPVTGQQAGTQSQAPPVTPAAAPVAAQAAAQSQTTLGPSAHAWLRIVRFPTDPEVQQWLSTYQGPDVYDAIVAAAPKEIAQRIRASTAKLHPKQAFEALEAWFARAGMPRTAAYPESTAAFQQSVLEATKKFDRSAGTWEANIRRLEAIQVAPHGAVSPEQQQAADRMVAVLRKLRDQGTIGHGSAKVRAMTERAKERAKQQQTGVSTTEAEQKGDEYFSKWMGLAPERWPKEFLDLEATISGTAASKARWQALVDHVIAKLNDTDFADLVRKNLPNDDPETVLILADTLKEKGQQLVKRLLNFKERIKSVKETAPEESPPSFEARDTSEMPLFEDKGRAALPLVSALALGGLGAAGGALLGRVPAMPGSIPVVTEDEQRRRRRIPFTVEQARSPADVLRAVREDPSLSRDF